MDIALSIVQQSLNCQTSIISRFHLIINNPFILHFCNIIYQGAQFLPFIRHFWAIIVHTS